MQKRLETDPSLSQFVGQFVPLKVTSTGDEWQQWASKFKYEGKGIPIIYVVRADGKQLYGKSGSLQGDGLLELLTTAAQSSGRILNEAEFSLLETCNQAAESALAEGELATAAAALSPISKMGVLGGLQSFAEPAMKADLLAKQIGEQAHAMVTTDVDTKLKDPEQVFEGVVELAQAEELYEDFPGVKSVTDALMKQVKKDKAIRAHLKPAKAIVKARTIALSPKAYDKKRAEKAYGVIIERFADTPAAEIARKELVSLNSKSEMLPSDHVASDDADVSVEATDAADMVESQATLSYDDEAIRAWADASGEFSVDAKLVEVTDVFVRLEKENGSEIKVPLKQLGDEAKAYLDSRK